MPSSSFPSRLDRRWLHVLPGLLCLALLLPGAGFRHLWQDEVDTAERARSVLAGGVPRIVDPEGRPSVNTGGVEIEEGELHRYSPWAQFYLGAIGLAIGPRLGLSEDASLRWPFTACHALSASALSLGLASLAGVPTLAALAVSGAFSLQSTRILYNRSARYHALLDVLFVVGLVALGAWARGRRRRAAGAALAAAIFLLPQTHSMGGGVLALMLVLGALFASPIGNAGRPRWREAFGPALLPAALSVALVLLQCRPWLQSAWSFIKADPPFRSLVDFQHVGYAAIAFALTVVALALMPSDASRARKRLLAPVLISVAAVIAIACLDRHPFSQTRYYLSLPLFWLFWPMIFELPKGQPTRIWLALALSASIVPELTARAGPLHGVRVALADRRMSAEGVAQPLMEALAIIRGDPAKGAVASDYVPQFVNWYLRDRAVALVPDPATRTELGRGNPIWSRPVAAPEWHLWFPGVCNGPWMCSPNCDAHVEDYAPNVGRYTLASRSALGERIEMCIVKRWRTLRWNNSPFAGEERAALDPSGVFASGPSDELVLARRCR